MEESENIIHISPKELESLCKQLFAESFFSGMSAALNGSDFLSASGDVNSYWNALKTKEQIEKILKKNLTQ